MLVMMDIDMRHLMRRRAIGAPPRIDMQLPLFMSRLAFKASINGGMKIRNRDTPSRTIPAPDSRTHILANNPVSLCLALDPR
ncbi:hypothetical protein CLV65_1469 [Pseudoscardovia suis]|uniref:Uncharacterized protein n=1 Tax=Pseudoscardovia suis TaxID=987063 RepID=A0A261F0Z6_9BIFI|nr:hypothetical protein PSSU_0361 [Pseudoscardovia suis]PJJ64918.1 hypothetical protein CLV65_1469 [Pseudoscardovia suis]